MRRTVETILRQYGAPMTIVHGEAVRNVRAIFQSVRSKSKQAMTNADTPLGEIPQGQYIYIGSAGEPVCEGDVLLIADRRYGFRRVERIWCGEEVAYLWGICIEEGSDG